MNSCSPKAFVSMPRSGCRRAAACVVRCGCAGGIHRRNTSRPAQYGQLEIAQRGDHECCETRGQALLGAGGAIALGATARGVSTAELQLQEQAGAGRPARAAQIRWSKLDPLALAARGA
jgi:hypothetical protein